MGEKVRAVAGAEIYEQLEPEPHKKLAGYATLN
jgi:hypothetical protein